MRTRFSESSHTNPLSGLFTSFLMFSFSLFLYQSVSVFVSLCVFVSPSPHTSRMVHLLSLLVSSPLTLNSRCLLVSCQMTFIFLLPRPVCCDVIVSGYDATSGFEAAPSSANSWSLRRHVPREASISGVKSAADAAPTMTEETES